jgi:hypothetical protein
MQYRRYGKTDKLISVISAGGMRYERPEDMDDMAEVMLTAARLGINYFDTAPGYSADKSEDILGLAVKEMRKEKLPHYVSTKTWAGEHDLVLEHIETSLGRIGVDCIDFMHTWGLNSWDTVNGRKQGGVFEALRKAKEQGMIGHVVCSSHMSGADIARLLDLGLVEGITLGFCAINFPFRLAGVEAAGKHDVGVVTMNPLGGGLIMDHPEKFAFIKSRSEESMLEAALRFNLSYPQITSALVGFRNVEDVQTAVAAVSDIQALTQDKLSAMQSHIEASFDELCTTCDYCRDCPEEIRVSSFMEAYNHYLLHEDYSRVSNRLKWHWGIQDLSALDRCTECGACESSCTQKLPILSRFSHMKALAAKASAG